MRAAGSPDALIIINGPQDGTEFPIVHNEVKIGQDRECAVNIQLDRNVLAQHGVATAAGEGYRIRSTAGAPLIVNGKRVGRLKSRLLKPGEVMRVGYTDLLLECSPDGMARRSKGVKVPTDFTWAIKGTIAWTLRIFDKLGRIIAAIPRFAWHNKFITIILVIIAMKFVPGVEDFVMGLFNRLKSELMK